MRWWVLAGAMCAYPALAAAQSTDVVELTVDQIHAAYADGEYTAVELTHAFLDRIEQYEDSYNAFISMNPQTRCSPPLSSTNDTPLRGRSARCTACR